MIYIIKKEMLYRKLKRKKQNKTRKCDKIWFKAISTEIKKKKIKIKKLCI